MQFIQNLWAKRKDLISISRKTLLIKLSRLHRKPLIIKELNKSNISTQIKTINYLCKLFGNNYINYLKKKVFHFFGAFILNISKECLFVEPSTWDEVN